MYWLNQIITEYFFNLKQKIINSTNAIEGNTLNLQQTRHIIENRMAINGKSLIEHQEVLGLDAALRFINETLLYRAVGELSLNDLLDIHRRLAAIYHFLIIYKVKTVFGWAAFSFSPL